MKSLEVSGAVRPIYGSLGVKWLMKFTYCLFWVKLIFSLQGLVTLYSQ